MRVGLNVHRSELNSNLLYGFTTELKNKYPQYIQVIINNALENNYETVVSYLFT